MPHNAERRKDTAATVLPLRAPTLLPHNTAPLRERVILDKNVFTNISQGNRPAAEALKLRLKTARVYISRAAYNELVIDSPTPFLRDHYRQMLKDLGIDVAPEGNMAGRVSFYADNIQYEPKKGQPGRVIEYGGKEKATPGDMFVAAETRSLRGRLWTFDKGLAKRAANMGVEIAPESDIPYVKGTEDPVTGRKLLGLKPARFMSTPKIDVRVRAIQLSARSAMRSAVAEAGEIALTLGLAIALALIQYWMTKSWMENKIKEGLKKIAPQIDERLNKLKPDIAKLQLTLDKGEQAFANVAIQIHYIPTSLGSRLGDYLNPEVVLADVNITAKDIKSERKFSLTLDEINYTTREPTVVPNVRRDVQELTSSFEVAVFSEEELELFRDLSFDYSQQMHKLRMNPSDEIVHAEAKRLRQEIIHFYGPENWLLVTAPDLP